MFDLDRRPSTSFVNHNGDESGAFTGRFHPARKTRVEYACV